MIVKKLVGNDKPVAHSTLYPVAIFWSDEDNVYIAIAPDLEGCSAGGGNGSGNFARITNCHDPLVGSNPADKQTFVQTKFAHDL